MLAVTLKKQEFVTAAVILPLLLNYVKNRKDHSLIRLPILGWGRRGRVSSQPGKHDSDLILDTRSVGSESSR